MNKKTTDFKNLITNSESILLLSHANPDLDAVCSTLLLSHLINKHFKNKSTTIIYQEKDWPRFSDYKIIDIEKINNLPDQTIDLSIYDLIIISDVDRLDRCLKNYIGYDGSSKKTVVIDHHNYADPDKPMLYFNTNKASAVEEIYNIFQDMVGSDFKPDAKISQYIQLGIIADSNRFLRNKVSTETYEIMTKTTKHHKLNLEAISKLMFGLNPNSIKILLDILGNLEIKGSVAYSFISGKVEQNSKFTKDELESAKHFFKDNFLLLIDGVDWGYLITSQADPNRWTLRFRSISNTVDVGKIAKLLGGGGHTNVSGAIVDGKSPKEVAQHIMKVAESMR
ncbi:MAG: DHH family phosphoesterase [Patescibacteria group bacterium]|nr:DHH family phosphoesterase [Patescibacteria group bacterium]